MVDYAKRLIKSEDIMHTLTLADGVVVAALASSLTFVWLRMRPLLARRTATAHKS